MHVQKLSEIAPFIPVVWHCLLSCCQTKATDLSSTWEQFPGWRRSRSTCWRTLSCCVRLTRQSCTSRNWPSTSSTFSREWQWMRSLKPINLTLSLPAVHAKYTPGNQQCCAEAHCSSEPAVQECYIADHCLPTLKLLCLLTHPLLFIHIYQS